MKIILMRHGCPQLDLDKLRKQKVAPKDFAPILAEYEQGDLAPDSFPPQEALDAAQSCEMHFSSTLQRALTSVERLGVSTSAKADDVFVESGIPHTNWTTPKLSALTWSILFRLAWLVGFSQNGEAFADAKRRAVKGADLLESAALKGDAFLLAHGIINRVIARELKRRGWQKQYANGEDYWSYSVFEKLG